MNANSNKAFSYQRYLPVYQLLKATNYDVAYEANTICIASRCHAFIVARDSYEGWAGMRYNEAEPFTIPYDAYEPCTEYDEECDMQGKPLSWIQRVVQFAQKFGWPTRTACTEVPF